ncbi:MAG: thioredoxin family protein [Bacteroidota bacterium]|nr:thioredoxin family protein [Bacteroidota bacterium]
MKYTFSSFRRSALLLAFLFTSGFLFAQSEHAKWTFSVVNTGLGEAELIMKADVEKNWHLFALISHDGEEGALPTEFTFNPNPNYELVGGVIETQKPIKHYEDGFGTNAFFFHGTVIWKQKIKIKSATPFTITGEVNGQTCADGEGGMCVLVYSAMKFDVAGTGPIGPTGGTGTKTIDTPTIIKNDSTPVHPDTTIHNEQAGNCNCTTEIEKAVANAMNKNHGHPIVDTAACNAQLIKPTDAELKGGEEVDKSYWGIFIAGFIGGLIALLTPCVFPMIPLTVSFFTKRSKDRKSGIRNAFIYALSIIGIYVTLGMVITLSLGPDALNAMSSSALFNLLFFFVFIVFAISFLGAFEITLPSRFINKVDSASDRGGLMGIFFMAFTLSLVSFSCTGPIIGTLLVEAAQGSSVFGPAIGMGGFALALALPFALFAMFPGWLNSLPKSGGWLNSVKVTLGFIEIGLAMKFLSNVDLAYHWGFLKRELFLAIWIVISILLGLYLLGKLRLSHDSEMKHVSTTRVMLALITFAFAAYLTPGMFGAPTTFVSGYLPPNSYREWKDKQSTDCPQDLSCFHDLKEGLCYAKSQGKPVFIDFTGYSCVNCRKMEDNVWSDPKVYEYLNEKYVVISLYVDDKEGLPQEQQYLNKDGRPIRTIGNKWSQIETDYYQQNSQPLYVLVDNDGRLLTPPKGYTPEAPKYVDYLELGMKKYEERKSMSK